MSMTNENNTSNTINKVIAPKPIKLSERQNIFGGKSRSAFTCNKIDENLSTTSDSSSSNTEKKYCSCSKAMVLLHRIMTLFNKIKKTPLELTREIKGKITLLISDLNSITKSYMADKSIQEKALILQIEIIMFLRNCLRISYDKIKVLTN